MEDALGIQLVQDRLSCAEKVGDQQYKHASKLVEECKKMSTSMKNSIQRLVYYFSEALSEKIDREAGKITGKGRIEKWSQDANIRNSATISFHEKLPLIQVIQFTGIQSMVDHVSAYRKVHIIDLEIRCGIYEMILMEDLSSRAECPINHIKITAVSTDSRQMIEETGSQLKILAQSLKLSFSFHMVMLEDIMTLDENHFELDSEEAIAVHAAYLSKNMIAKPNELETLINHLKHQPSCDDHHRS